MRVGPVEKKVVSLVFDLAFQCCIEQSWQKRPVKGDSKTSSGQMKSSNYMSNVSPTKRKNTEITRQSFVANTFWENATLWGNTT